MSEMCLVPDLGVKNIIIAAGGDDEFAPADDIGDLLNAVLQWKW